LSAGPTEILIIAGQTADPFVVAVDLLSQAEHGPDSPAVLLTTSALVAERTMAVVEEILPDMPTKDMAEPAWRNYGAVHVMDTLEEAHSFADHLAFEHVEGHARSGDIRAARYGGRELGWSKYAFKSGSFGYELAK
jgi:sulfopropanediol 3-dehydrogenase